MRPGPPPAGHGAKESSALLAVVTAARSTGTGRDVSGEAELDAEDGGAASHLDALGQALVPESSQPPAARKMPVLSDDGDSVAARIIVGVATCVATVPASHTHSSRPEVGAAVGLDGAQEVSSAGVQELALRRPGVATGEKRTQFDA